MNHRILCHSIFFGYRRRHVVNYLTSHIIIQFSLHKKVTLWLCIQHICIYCVFLPRNSCSTYPLLPLRPITCSSAIVVVCHVFYGRPGYLLQPNMMIRSLAIFITCLNDYGSYSTGSLRHWGGYLTRYAGTPMD